MMRNGRRGRFSRRPSPPPGELLLALARAPDLRGTGAQSSIESREDYTFSHWKDELDGKVLRNLLTAAEQLA